MTMSVAVQSPAPTDRLHEPRAVTALALGLAYSHLERTAAVTELVTSADRRLLVAALTRFDVLGNACPEMSRRARELLIAALRDTGVSGSHRLSARNTDGRGR